MPGSEDLEEYLQMKCAWFDEKNYFEFFPLQVFIKGRKKEKENLQQVKLEVLFKEPKKDD